MSLVAQGLGVIAIIIWVFSIQQKKRKKLLIYQGWANAIYAIEYFLLHAYSAASLNVLTTIRSMVFYYQKKQSKLTLLFFTLLIAVIGYYTYDNLLSLVPITINILYACSVWQSNLKTTIIIFIIAAFIWIPYNYYVGAYITIFGNLLEIISGLIALKKYNQNDKHKV